MSDKEIRTKSVDDSLSRYSRQMLFERIGEEGQRRLRSARAVLIGCGALGSVLAETLVRAGIGHLRICDRDFLERDNLQRQVLFDEDDLAANLPKAEAAAVKLRRINSEVDLDAQVVDVNPVNVETLADGAQVLLDGTDNFETRFLINDLAVKSNRPWVYGAVIGATGLCMTILPRETPCLRCVFEEAPPPEMNPTCDTAGVLASTVGVIASLQAVEAIKLLCGRREDVCRQLTQVDVWSGRFASLNVQGAYDNGDCPSCKRGLYDYLKGKMSGITTTLCGRDAVQVHPGSGRKVDLYSVAKKLKTVAGTTLAFNQFLLRFTAGGYEITLFPDGRAIIKGTHHPDTARTLYSRYIGA